MDKVTLSDITIKSVDSNNLSFNIKPWHHRWLSDLLQARLAVEIKPFKEKRSLRQNALLWAVISQIDGALNGRTSEDGEMAIYCNLICMARIKTFIYQMSVEAYEETIKKGIFRYVETIELDEYEDKAVVRCYPGTSKFDTKEMNDFIETTLDYAEKVGINTSEFEELKEIHK